MHSIWAVAVNTIRQALRMKIAVAFTVLLVILLPVMGLTMTGDGTLKGRLQTFVSYSLSLTGFLLCILTIVTSSYSLTSDIKYKQIFTVMTKPIRRFELIFGKLLGIILLDLIMLIIFASTIYAITLGIPKMAKPGRTDMLQVKNEFFTARTSLTPVEVDVEKEVLVAYEKLKKSGQFEEYFKNSSRQSILAELRRRKKIEKRAAVPGHTINWQFNNVKTLDPNDSLFIRFKYDVSRNPPDLQVFSRWTIGDDRQIKYSTEIKTPIYVVERKDLIRTFFEIKVPADAIAPDGYLAVNFLNDPVRNNVIVIFPPEDGLEILFKTNTFTANFVRAVIMIFYKLVFLACLGIFTSTFLTFPVAVLVCFAVFFAGSISGFALESFSYLGENVGKFYSYTVGAVVRLLPQFDKFNPNKFIVDARILSWTLLAKAAGIMVLIKAGLTIFLSLIVFGRKEIAKVII